MREKHMAQFTHKPDLTATSGSAATSAASSKRAAEKDRDAIFGRLYDQHGEKVTRQMVEREAQEAERSAAILESSFIQKKLQQKTPAAAAASAGGASAETVAQRRPPPLTPAQTTEHVNRYIFK